MLRVYTRGIVVDYDEQRDRGHEVFEVLIRVMSVVVRKMLRVYTLYISVTK